MRRRRIKIQMAVFTTIALAAIGAVMFGYFKAPGTFSASSATRSRCSCRRPGDSTRAGNVTYRGVAGGPGRRRYG